MSKWVVIILFMVFNVSIGLIWARAKKKIDIQLSDKAIVTILFDNILNAEGNIVIPFNSCFDVIVDDIVISSTSLHGQFIDQVYGSNVRKLEESLAKRLDVDLFSDSKYPLGTTIKIEEKGKQYFLFALSDMDEHNKAYIALREYNIIINKLLIELHNHSQGKKVNLPLLGAGLAGVDLSKQELLENLLFQIRFNKNLNFNAGINVILDNRIRQEISLDRINVIFNKK